jgi:hypothetical protein
MSGVMKGVESHSGITNRDKEEKRFKRLFNSLSNIKEAKGERRREQERHRERWLRETGCRVKV